MDVNEVQTIARHALAESRRVREDDLRRRDQAGDFGQEARAWERLADAADALHAVIVRRGTYRDGEPVSLDESQQFQG